MFRCSNTTIFKEIASSFHAESRDKIHAAITLEGDCLFISALAHRLHAGVQRTFHSQLRYFADAFIISLLADDFTRH